MNTHIETRDPELAPSLLAHVESELEASIGPFANSVLSISVALNDGAETDDSEGCKASVGVNLRHRTPVHVTTVQGDLYSAVSVAARRCQRVMERSLGEPAGWEGAATTSFHSPGV